MSEITKFMTNFAYLRVSTDKQDAQNQKYGLLDYCHHKKINELKFVEDSVSGSVSWKERAICEILTKAKAGDLIVVSEISRLGRSTLQVLEILEFAAKNSISIHIAKNNIVMDGSMQYTITATILGLAAQIEREFISSRTKESLQKLKQDGIKLGRPKGSTGILKLDQHHDEIVGYLKKKINKRNIAKLVDCSPSTLYAWLNKRTC